MHAPHGAKDGEKERERERPKVGNNQYFNISNIETMNINDKFNL